MQVVSDPDTALGGDPCAWINQSDFVRQSLAGDLIGVTGNGHGVYIQEATTELWDQEQEWQSSTTYVVTHAVPKAGVHPEFDCTLCPPSGGTLEDASVTLDGGDEQLANYILETTENHGCWKVLTARGWQVLANSDINLSTTPRPESIQSDPEDATDAVPTQGGQ